jgi:hypothetical protein
MSTNNFWRSDLYTIHGIVQNSMIIFPKEIVIATLRDFFSRDTTWYSYRKDQWGFANTVDETDLPLGAGLNDNTTTRLFIGENYRYDGIFYPAVLVKHGGGRYVQVSFNRDATKVQWHFRTFEDGYGNVKAFRTPAAFVFSGAWEGSLAIDVITRSLRARDELVELVAICLQQITFESVRRAGLVIKPLSWSAPTESDDRNDKLFRTTFTIDIRSEWEVHQPIGNVIDAINFAIEFGRVDVPNYPIAKNLTIDTETTFLDLMDLAMTSPLLAVPTNYEVEGIPEVG